MKTRLIKRRRHGGSKITQLPRPAGVMIASNNCGAPHQIGFTPDDEIIQRAAVPPDGMYCFVVKRANDQSWRFVALHHGRGVLMDHPRQFFSSPSAAMADFWISACLAGEVGWDEPCDPSTLRLIRLNVDIEDATHHLFRDADHRRESERLAAVAKLTDAECRLLGLTTERAKLKLHRGGNTPSFTSLMDEVADLFMCRAVSDKMFEGRSSASFRLSRKQKRAKGS